MLRLLAVVLVGAVCKDAMTACVATVVVSIAAFVTIVKDSPYLTVRTSGVVSISVVVLLLQGIMMLQAVSMTATTSGQGALLSITTSSTSVINVSVSTALHSVWFVAFLALLVFLVGTTALDAIVLLRGRPLVVSPSRRLMVNKLRPVAPALEYADGYRRQRVASLVAVATHNPLRHSRQSAPGPLPITPQLPAFPELPESDSADAIDAAMPTLAPEGSRRVIHSEMLVRHQDEL